MSTSESGFSLDAFLARLLDEGDPAGAAAFAAAVVGEEAAREEGGWTAGVSYENWRTAVRYGVPETSATEVVREYNFDPNEPRDERGGWTTGGFERPTCGRRSP